MLSHRNEEQLTSVLPSDWSQAISARGIELSELYKRVDDMYASKLDNRVSPFNRSDVFRAFHYTPLESVRVVILGNAPYPNPNQAHGLAFSVPVSFVGKRPPSLGKIFAALKADLGETDLGITRQTSDLSVWAERGMLLLNSSLTHQPDVKKPIDNIWKDFIEATLEVVKAKTDPVAWLLWGEHAIGFANRVGFQGLNHRAFKNAHPNAGRSARSRIGDNPPFSEASTFLGSDPISDWRL